jgi:hypothetical protein
MLEGCEVFMLVDHRQESLTSGGPGEQRQTGTRIFFHYQLTDIGARFLEACHSSDGDGE